MITKISKLNSIGKFSFINQNSPFIYGERGNNCNIIFGLNGSGKTTLSNAISFFGNNLFISEESKMEVFNDIKNVPTSSVELEVSDGNKIRYPSTSHAQNKPIYVFNSNFIANHVFNGTKGKVKRFSSITGEIKNKEIERINLQIEALSEEKTRLEKENEKLEKNLEDITKTKSKSFGKTLTDLGKRLVKQDLQKTTLPSNSIQDLEEKLQTLTSDYELSKKQDELNADLEELRQLTFPDIYVDFDKTNVILTKNVQQLSKEVLEKKIIEIQNLFLDEPHQQSVERWLRYGKDVLEKISSHEKKNCPLCNTDISDKLNSLLLDYQGYFNESYEDFINELKTKTNEISTIISSLDLYEKDVEKLNKIFIKYKKLLNGLIFEKFDFTIIKKELSQLEKALIEKNDNINSHLCTPFDISYNFIQSNDAILKAKNLKVSILNILESKKLDTHTIEGSIRQIYNAIIILEFNESDNQTESLERYKKNRQRISIIQNNTELGLPFFKNKLKEELLKIKTESKSISKYLVKMGIDHFNIDINEDNLEENIIITYKRSLTEKNRLRNCLSDGEKTALAFAYFLSKFDNEINTTEKVKESVVVIDDPISSLDENRLYSTAYLIWSNFEKIKQLIVLSHNFLFLKFFNSFYRGKATCLLLEGERITDLPDELINFETPYFYMLKAISDFIDKKITYNEAKRYLPNYIRRVLETFLSFKFSKIVNKNGGYRSPGLSEFKDNINNTTMDDTIKKELQDKISQINRITDAHSHGNAHHTQENFYISEPDLIILSSNAISVIETMDNLHKTCFFKEDEKAN